MNEFVGQARNIYYVKKDEAYEPQVELLFFSSEPQWAADINGLKSSRDELSVARLSTGKKGLKIMIQYLQKILKELDGKEA